MKIQNWEIPAGKLIVFSEGEYSDFGYIGHFVTLQDITSDAVLAAQSDAVGLSEAADMAVTKWFAGGKEGEYPGHKSIHGCFIAALIQKGLLMSVDVEERHIGSYGELEIN